MRPERRIRLLVLGASTDETCGVRDCAAVLEPALRRAGFDVETLWWQRDAEGEVVASLAEARRHAAEVAERARHADVVLWHYTPFGYGVRGLPILLPLVVRSLRRSGTPVVGLLHELAFAFRPGGWRSAVLAAAQRAALVPLLRLLSAAAVTSDDRERWLQTRRWLPRRRVLAHPVPSNLPAASPAPAPGAGFRIGIFGFRREAVDAVTVADAVARVRALGIDARLVLVGAPGPASAQADLWRRAASRADVGEALEFTGILDAQVLSDVLTELDTLLFLDQAGPTGRRGTLAAALAAGRPVVALDGPRRWDALVEAGAVLLASTDPDALAATLERVARDPDLRHRLGGSAARFYAERMSAGVVAESLSALLREAARRPRVAIVAHDIHDHGGMERVFAELLRRTHEVVDYVVVSATLAPDLRPLVEWRRVPVPPRPFPLKFALFAVLAPLRLLGIRRDLVHTLGAIVPNRADMATVQFCHAGYIERCGRLAPAGATRLRRINTALTRVLSLLAERWCYRLDGVRLLACVSAGVGREIERNYPGRVVLITPNGIDTERFDRDPHAARREREAYGVRDGDAVCLFVGGDWDRKGLAVAIAGLAEARRLATEPLYLWVVGHGDESRFRALAQEHRVSDAVRFFGLRGDAERFFRAADVFVLPTEYETFSLVAYEAAASGLPIVAPAVSGIDELVGADEAGILVERKARPVGLALARLAGDPVLRERLGRAGRARAARFEWTHSVDSVLTAYASLLRDEPLAPEATC